jgi:hypothetical protein
MKFQSLIQACAVLVLIAAAGPAVAGDCAVQYNRTACAGKEAESYSKCDGKASCVQTEQTATAEACQAAALKACANDRLTITKSKVITAKFDGKQVMSASGKEDFCADYAKRAAEFDQCAK